MKDDLTIYLPSVIDLDQSKAIGNCFIANKNQPVSIHKAIEKLSYYFKNEFNFDYVQYTAFGDMNNAKSQAYIWIDDDWDDTFAVGACCFRFLGDVGQCNKWSLEWIWFHPYYRNKGLLAGAWKSFEKKYGKDFHIQPPLSKGMERFLEKMREKNGKI